jgi:hypothetical protein
LKAGEAVFLLAVLIVVSAGWNKSQYYSATEALTALQRTRNPG